MFKNNRGFTLIEMLIVLMIISVLIILIVPNLSGRTKEVNSKGCQALVSVVQTQVEAYALDHGQLPSDLQQLAAENYISEEQFTCPNNKNLVYDSSSGKVSAPN